MLSILNQSRSFCLLLLNVYDMSSRRSKSEIVITETPKKRRRRHLKWVVGESYYIENNLRLLRRICGHNIIIVIIHVRMPR